MNPQQQNQHKKGFNPEARSKMSYNDTFFHSYKWKYVQEVPVNCLVKLAKEKQSG